MVARRKWLVLRWGLTVLLLTAPAMASTPSKTQAEIRYLIHKCAEAYARKDVAFLMSVCAPDPDVLAIGTAEDEKRIGPEAIRTAYEKFFAQVESVSVLYSDILVKSRGDVAWVYAEGHVSLKTDRGEFTRKSRLTSVLEKRKGKWLFVQTHASFPVPD